MRTRPARTPKPPATPAHGGVGANRLAATRRQAPCPAWPPTLHPVSLAACLLFTAPAALALPTGAVLTGGQASVQQTAPGQMLIRQGTPKASLDWTNFSIAAGEAVDVVQPGRSSVLLNRVVGDNPSLIYGALRSNGSVWLINPRGIVFGASSRVDVGGLVASTLSLNGDALAGGRLQLGAGAGGAAELRSEGQITAIDGSVALVAPRLLHSGQITARRVGLAAASEVLVDVEGDGLVFFNVRNEGLDTRLALLGGVRADGGTADLRAAARAGFADTVLNLEGVVQARSIGVREGRIVIDGGAGGITRVAGTLDAGGDAGGRGGSVLVQGDKVLLDRSAVVDASGGTGGGSVRVGGDFQGRNPDVRHARQVVVQAGARLAANATDAGDGGSVVVWSDEATRFVGRADARGGARGGDGGLVEVSGKAYLDFRGQSDRSAPAGRAGRLLLDPTNLEIVDTGPDIDGDASGDTDDLTGGTLAFDAPGTDSKITAGAVVAQLDNGPVLLQAVNDITVTQGFTSTRTNTLTLEAGNNLTVGALSGGITTAGDIVLSASTTTITGATTTGAVTLNAAVTTGATRSITLNNGGGTGVHQVGANLSAGTLAVTGDVDLTAASTWTLANDTTFNNTLTGAAALTKSGAGTLTLGGAAAYTGNLTLAQGGLTLAAALGSTTIAVNAGTLTVDAADVLADAAALNVAAGATLSLAASDTITSLSLAGTLAGGAADTLRATGTATLTGATVDAGLRADTLASSGDSVLRAAVVADTSVQVTGGTLTVGDGATAGSLAAPAATVAAGAALVYARSDDTNLSTSVSGAGTLRQSGGNLLLTGGAEQVSTALLDVALGVVVLPTGETNRIKDTTDLTVGAGAALAVDSASETLRNLGLAGGTVGGTGTLTVAGALTSSGSSRLLAPVVVTGASSVTGGVLKVGDGSLTLDGSLTANGGLSVASGAVLDFDSSTASIGTVGGTGTLRVSRGAATLNGTALAVTAVQVDGGSLTLADGVADRINNNATLVVAGGASFSLGSDRDETVGSFSLAGTLASSGRVLTAATTTLATGALVNGALGAGTLEVTGDSTLAAATAATTVNVRSGANLTRSAGGDFAPGAQMLVENGATLTLGGDDSITRLTLAGALAGGATHTLSASGAFTLQDGATVDAGLGGAATLDTDGAVALNQAAAATTVRINTGTLTLGADGLLAGGASVTVASGATLAMGGTASIGTLALAGTVSGGSTLSTGTLSAGVNGSAPVVNASVSVTGGVDIASGVQLSVGNGGSTGALDVGGTLTVNSGGTLVLNRDSALNATDLLGSGTVAGGGTLRHAGTSTLTLDKGVTTLGAVEVSGSGGNLVLGNGSNNRIGNTAAISVAGGSTLTMGNQAETVGTLNLSGTLAGTSTLSAGTTTLLPGSSVLAPLGGGTLVVSGSGSSSVDSVVGATTVQVNDGATLALGASANLAGTAAVTVASGGTLQLGANDSIGTLALAGSLTGAFTLSAGGGSTLQTGGLVALGSTLAGGTLNVTGDATLNGRADHATVTITDTGTLRLGPTPDRLNDDATVNLAAGGTLELSVDETINTLVGPGTVSGTGTLFTAVTQLVDGQNVNSTINANTLVSNGNVRISSTVNVTGNATVQSGTLTVGSSNGNNGSFTVGGTTTVADGATLAYFRDNTPSITLNGDYNGAGTFRNNNSAEIIVGGTLGTANVLLSGGDLSLATGSTDRLADTATVTVASGRTLTLDNAAETVGSLALNGGTLAGSGTLSATTTTLAAGSNVNAPLGAGVLNVNGAATLRSAAGSGSVNVNAGGALTLTATGSLDALADVVIASGATLTLAADDAVRSLNAAGRLAGSGFTLTTSNGSTLQTGALIDANLGTGALTVSGNSRLNGSSAAATLDVTGGTLTLGSAGRLTGLPLLAIGSAPGASLVLAGNEAVAAFTSAGSLTGPAGARLVVGGTATLLAGAVVNTELGTATLIVDGNAALNRLATASTVNVSDAVTLTTGAADLLADTAAVTVGAGATLALGGGDTVGTLALAGTLGGNGRTLRAGSVTLQGSTQVIANLDAGSLAVASGSATLAGTAAVGTLDIAAGASLELAAAGRFVGSAPVAQLDGSLTLAGDETLGSLAGSGTLALGSATLTTGGAGSSFFDGAIVGSGGLTKVGTGTIFALGGSHGYTGPTTVEQGTLQLANSEVLADGSSVVVAAPAVLALAGLGSTETLATLNLNGTLAGIGRLQAGSYVLAGGSTAAGTTLGTGQIVSTGSSTLNGNTQADVRVDSGSFALGSAGRLVSASASVDVRSGATLTLGGDENVGSLSLAGTLGGGGRLSAGTHSLAAGATVDADLGGGTLTVGGDATLNGNAQVAVLAIANGATLTLGATPDRIADSAALTLAAGGQLRLGGDETVGTLTLAGTVGTAGRRLSATTITLEPGAQVLADLSAGTLAVTGTATLGGSGSSTLQGSADVPAVSVDGGTLVLGSAQRLAANSTVTVAAGATLQIGGDENLSQLRLSGTLAGASGTLTAGAATGYVLDGGTVDAALGSGVMTVAGASTLNATAAAGSVDVLAGGTLVLGAGGQFSAAPVVDVAATGTLTLGSSQTFGALGGSGDVALGSHTLSTGTTSSSFDGVLSGNASAGLVKLGGGSFSLGGSHSYGGATRVMAGTLALQGNDVLPDASAVTVDLGATLALGGSDTVASLTLAGTLAGNGTLTAPNTTLLTGAATAADAHLGTGALSVLGDSTLAGTSAAGGVAITGGTLTLASADRLADNAALSVAAGTGLALNGDDRVGSLTLAGSLGGVGHTLTATVGAVTLQAGATVAANLGTGTLNVTGDATLSGTAASATVNVDAGVLTLATAGRLNAGAAVSVRSGSTLLLGGDESVGTLTLGGTLDGSGHKLGAASYTLEPGATVLADLGAGTLTVAGTGTLGGSGDSTLAGTADAGTVHVDGGRLVLGAADRLDDNAAVTVAGGATLRLNGDDRVHSLALSGTLEGSGTLSADNYVLDGGTYNLPLGDGELVSSGNSTLNATSAATVVTVTGGTLTLGAAHRFTQTPALTVAGGAALSLGGDETVGSLAGAGAVALGTFTLTSTGAAETTFSGSLTGTGGLTKQGSTRLTLSGDNSYTGSTRIEDGTLALPGTLASLDVQLTGGTLALGATERLADGAVLTVASGALVTLSGNERITALNLAGRLAGSGTLDADSVTLASAQVDADLGGGSLTAGGNASASSVLNGHSAATQLAVTGGTLTLAGAGRLSAAPATTVAAGATLALQGDTTLGALAGDGEVTLGSHTLSADTATDSRFDGTVSGTGGLVKSGSSVLTLGGANSYSGPTTVQAGTLATAGADRLADATAVDVATGATLALGGSDTVASLALAGTLGGTGTLTAASYSLAAGTVNTELGTGTLSSTGASRLAAPAGATTVQVSSGTLTLAAGDLLADGAALGVASGATLVLGGDDRVTSLALAGTLGGSGTLTADTTTLASGRVAVDARLGRGALASSGTSALIGSAASDTVTVSDGTLTLASAGRLTGGPDVTVASGATLALNGDETAASLALAGTLGGSGTWSAATVALNSGQVLADLGGGTLSSSGSSTLAGHSAATTLNVDAGALTLASPGRLGAAPLTSVAGGATLALGGDETLGTLTGAGSVGLGGSVGTPGATLTTGSRGDSRFDGVLSGASALAKAGSSSFTLGGANAYSGSTTVREGTLATAAAGVLPDASDVAVDSGARLQLGGDDTVATLRLAGTLDGSSTLQAASYTLDGGTANANLGSGRLVSSGSSTLAGRAAAAELVVDGGTLSLASANRLADDAVLQVARRATLHIAGDDTVGRADIAGTLAGTGTFSATRITLDGGRVDAALGGGALTSTGDSRLNATSQAASLAVEGGTLTLGAAGRMLRAPAVTLAPGTALVLGGDETLGTLAGSGSLALGAATLRSGVGGDSSYGGVISGSGGFVKQGGSRFTLAAGQAYTGATAVEDGTLVLEGTLATQALQVNAGTLALAAADRLPDTSPVSVASGARLTLAGDDTVATLALAGTLAGSGTLSAASYTLDGGRVDADLGTGSLTSIGTSVLNGRAAASTVAVNGGTLTLGGANRLTALPALSVADGATLQLGGDLAVGTLTGAGTVELVTHTLTSAGLADASYTGRINGSGGFVKQGSTRFTLGGVNGYTGSTLVEGGSLNLTGTLASLAVQIDAGTLVLTGSEQLADTAQLTVASGAVASLAGLETIAGLSLSGSLTGAGGLVAASYLLDGGTASVATLGPGLLRSRGSSTLDSTSAAGTVQVDGGTLALGAGGRFTAAPRVTVAGVGTLALGGDETLGTLAGAGNVALASHTLSTGSRGSSSFTGVLGGSGELVKQGTSTFTLGGANTASGATRVLAGTLQVDGTLASSTLIVGTGATLALTAAERLPDDALVDVQPGATLTLAGDETVAGLRLAGTLAGSGTLSAASYSLDGGTANTELGTGTLSAAGSSRLAAAAAAGSVTVSSGTLTLAAGNLLADTAAVTVASGATLVLDASDSVASLTLAGTLAGSGTLGAATYLLDGGSAIANLGTGALRSRGSSTLAGSAAVASLGVETGTLTLASAQRLSAAPAVQLDAAGTLALAGNQSFGTLSGSGALALGSFTLATGSGGDSTFAGVIGGSGGLVKQGSSSVFTLTGTNTYTGATQIEAGTLRLGNGLDDGSPGTTSGSLASSAFEVEGLLELARADDITLPQPVSGGGGVRQAGSGRVLFSGNNKTYTGDTTVARGALATAGADELPDGSAVHVDAAGRLALGGRETLRSLEADGPVALAGDLAAGGDLLLRGTLATGGPLQLSGERIEALNAGNRFGGALALDARGAVALSAGADSGGAALDLVLGRVRVADGGRIEAGRLTLGSETTVDGGTLQLVATAQPGGLAPDAALAGKQAIGLPIAWAEDTVRADDGSRIGVAAGATLDIVASGGGSVRLLDAGNSFAGSLSVVSSVPDTPWSVNTTALSFGGGAAQNHALQSRVQVNGLEVNIGGAGIVADVVGIRADRLATVGTGAAGNATVVARLPYDSAAGTASQLPGLTLELTPEAYNLSFPFGAPGADGALRVNVGSRAYGNRTLPLDAGYVTVLPRDGARGSTAVLLLGPAVNAAGGYRFFFDGAGRQTEIPVFYNGVLPTTPQVENSLSAAVAVSESARKERFDEAVRTENVAVRLRAGVIAEVGPAPSATQGTEGLRVPASCPPQGSSLGCAKAP